LLDIIEILINNINKLLININKINPFELIQIPVTISAKIVLYLECGLREKE